MANVWEQLRESQNVEDRTNEPWPWHPVGAKKKDPVMMPTMEYAESLKQSKNPQVPMATPLAQQLGAMQVAPPTDSEMMRFITDIEMMNPYEPTKRMNDPMKRK